ncbi:hypothetical protein COP1_008115 [Malus domestica]|uniref:Xylanase inhibitor C-terminal domain-containing protein n=1 Tax=Malus domestica TaxID=3750 RepID=A0A498IS64_MALDO|nr:hypothetical protein DVH24_027200 [Malus domestica]
MAKAISMFLLISSTTLVLGNKPNGFTMRLIYCDSPDSPFYPGNLTHAQTVDLLVRRTKARAYYVPFYPGQAPPSTFLRFGDDIPRKPGMFTRSLVRYPGEGYYYVNLIDLSLDDKRLHIPPDVFAHRAAGTTGTIIDSGGDISLLNNAAFNALKTALTNYFLQNGYDYLCFQ